MKHVFIDWSEVESSYGVALPGYYPLNASPVGVKIVGHTPTFAAQPILLADKPWEGSTVNEYSTLLKIGDEYRLYYEAFGPKYCLCMASSKDAVHWEKPSLGVCDFNGSKDNNIVWDADGTHGFTVLYEADAPADERFKMVYTTFVPVDGGPENGGSWLVTTKLACSPDGLHFTTVGDACRGGDTQSSFLRDPNTGKYLLYTKSNDPSGPCRRTIVRMEGETPLSLGNPELMLYTDPHDAPDVDHYTSAVNVWPGASGAYVAFPAFFAHTADTVNIQLYTSRNGKTWYRPLGTAPFVDCTPALPSHYCGCGIGDCGDGNWFVVVGSGDHGHNGYAGNKSVLRRAIVREDGFTSIRADGEGTFVTCELSSPITQMTLNATGSVRVEIVDRLECKPIPGFEADTCRLSPVPGNSAQQTVTWAKPLSELPKGPFRIKFYLTNADIYAYSI